MNITQALKELCKGNGVVLHCKYWERKEEHNFNPEYWNEDREIGFKHKVKCLKDDFIDISTFYGGNKKDCKFSWSLR